MTKDRKPKKYLAVTIDDVELDWGTFKGTDSKTMVAVLQGKGEQPITLNQASVKKFSLAAADLWPDNFEFELDSLVFSQDKSLPGLLPKHSVVTLSANLGAELDLSQIPVVGSSLSKEQPVAIENFTVLFSTKELRSSSKKNKRNVVADINRLIPPGVAKLPADVLKGATFSFTVRINGQPNCFSFTLGGKSKPKKGGNGGNGGKDDKKANPPPDQQNASTLAPIEPGLTKWILVNKVLGPLVIRRIGGRIHDGKIHLLLDALMLTGPLGVALEGLSVGSSLKKFAPKFNLDGLGIAYAKGPVTINGAFLRDKSDDSFSGLATIKTPGFSISALGAYEELNGEPSFFIYGFLGFPVGIGPTFFQLTGLSAGFGYNRTLKIPEIDQVRDFPLVSTIMGDEDQNRDPMAVLTNMKHSIPPAAGELFLAFGLKFNSFKLIDSFALMTVRLGRKFKLDLLGMARLSIPAKVSDPIAVIELAIKASYDAEEKSLKVLGILTPASFLISRNCRLTGGFAFCSWFGGEHAGDFVFTVGGYHPRYKVPAHYPQVPRLGFHWQLSSNIGIKGGMYFALTSGALMVGGRLEAIFETEFDLNFDIGIAGADLSGWVRAYFVIGADFLISWQPYYYDAHLYLEFGIAANFSGRVKFLFVTIHMDISFDLSLGASLHIWGPEFSGIAEVDLSIVSFEVSFGAAQSSKPTAISWTEFKDSFLPKENEVCTVAVESGLLRQIDDPDASEEKIHVIHPAELVLTVNSTVPFFECNNEGYDHCYGFGIASMDIGRVQNSKVEFEVKREVPQDEDVSDEFRALPIMKKGPEALWGRSMAANLNSGLTDDLIMGIQILPKAKVKPDQTEEKSVHDFSYDIELKENSYEWATSLDFQCEKGGDPLEYRQFSYARKNKNRDKILDELGLDPNAVDLQGLRRSANDAFLVSPEITKLAA